MLNTKAGKWIGGIIGVGMIAAAIIGVILEWY